MAVLAKTQHHHVKHRRLPRAQLPNGMVVGPHRKLRALELGGHGVETGLGAWAPGRQEGFAEHAGIAGGIGWCNPAFIPEQHIHPIPGQVLAIQGAVGLRRGAATGEGNLGPIPLVKGELDPDRDLFRTATG